MDNKNFAFDKVNYILLAVSMAVVVIGFLLMIGPIVFHDTLSKDATAVLEQFRASHVASSSNSFVKRDLCLAQGTAAVTTPCSGQSTRGSSATI